METIALLQGLKSGDTGKVIALTLTEAMIDKDVPC